MDGYKHFIRANEAGIIIHGFSSAFEQPQAGDLELTGQDGRHFQITLLTGRGQNKYKIANGAMVERTQQELDDEWASRPPAPPDRITELEQTVADLNQLLIEKGISP